MNLTVQQARLIRHELNPTGKRPWNITYKNYRVTDYIEVACLLEVTFDSPKGAKIVLQVLPVRANRGGEFPIVNTVFKVTVDGVPLDQVNDTDKFVPPAVAAITTRAIRDLLAHAGALNRAKMAAEQKKKAARIKDIAAKI